ncbi:NAD(P)-dependent oxidoreductase [Methylophilus flavus]|jgi:3-hydroxyisobutyrate dehydrogenase-like beta-hydroxyacid dehydrogenase|uniref:NAD(P)-dependent oxidoreductase n=1 Tax=Methylophilus flavus TaxID=640084 RepID=A0ABW3PAQ0_9PROT
MRIAFLGLGRMGSGMATRLAQSGDHTLTVWNRTADKAQRFTELGASIAKDPIEAVRDAEVVITSLLDDQSVEALFHEGSEVLKALPPTAIHLCVTTISPDCANRLQDLHAANGSRYVSGPVIGRPDASAAGKLVQFLAGDTSAIKVVSPICHAFAEQVMPLSVRDAGVANSQKLCINFFVASLIEVMGECFTLGEKLGVPRQNLAFFLDKSLPLPGLKVYVERLFKRETDSTTGFTMTAGRKDLGLMLRAAAAVDCDIDIATIIAEKMDIAISQGMQNLDWSATQEITRQRAGLLN